MLKPQLRIDIQKKLPQNGDPVTRICPPEFHLSTAVVMEDTQSLTTIVFAICSEVHDSIQLQTDPGGLNLNPIVLVPQSSSVSPSSSCPPHTAILPKRVTELIHQCFQYSIVLNLLESLVSSHRILFNQKQHNHINSQGISFHQPLLTAFVPFKSCIFFREAYLKYNCHFQLSPSGAHNKCQGRGVFELRCYLGTLLAFPIAISASWEHNWQTCCSHQLLLRV